MPVVLGLALVFRLFVFPLPPVLSDDAYRYVWDGLVQAEGVNPYLYRPSDPELAHLRNEPIYEELNSADYYTVYPPGSQLIFRLGALVYDGGWESSYYTIKGILALMEYGGVLVLARFLSPSTLLLYAWNPVVVLTGSGQAHGEAAMVLFLSLALYALKKRRGTLAGLSLVMAGWLKLYPFVLLPFLWRRYGWKCILASAGAAGIIALPYVHPAALGHVGESLKLYVRFFEFNAGPYYAVKELFYAVTGADWSKQVGPFFGGLFVVLLPVLYFADWKLSWPTRRSFAVTVGAFLALATTVHPWYLLGILVLTAPSHKPSWHWLWLSVASLGTYLLYVDGPYWTWVIAGWGGWAVLGLYRYRRPIADPLIRARAAEKAELLAPSLEDGWRVLDVGAGEGYVADALESEIGGRVDIVDVIDMNRTSRPLTVYDGRVLPYGEDEFDASVIVYVLHHAENPEAVLQEAVRVSAKRVVILESTYERDWERRPLRALDRLANEVRSDGRMEGQDSFLHLRTHAEWLALFERLGIPVVGQERLGGFIHHPSLFVLDASGAPLSVSSKASA